MALRVPRLNMNENQKILIFENSNKLTEHLLKEWIELAKESILARGQFTVAISGGKTPIEFYKRLASLKDSQLWSKTHIFQTDERFVPADNYENNFRSFKTHLLNHISIPALNIHPMKTDLDNVTLSAATYENDLKSFFPEQPFPIFDLILLGIGEDGHTASLFPAEPAVDEKKKFVVGVSTQQLTTQRISLTLPVINQARNIVFVVTGASKAGVVRRIIMNKTQLPASKVEPVAGNLFFLLDQPAGAKLKEGQ